MTSPVFQDDDGHRQGREGSFPARPPFIKAEANLLRLPLFALSTKGLRRLDGIECRGTTTRNGQTHNYRFRVTRNTATLYPGLLSRAAHQSLLSILTERGLPAANPISWTWRDLCRRMGILYSGRTVRLLKAALAATRGVLIDSQHAIYSKPDGELVSTTQRHLSLYGELAFVNGRMPDGGVADANYVWLADWYLDNLNALFTAPLDYDLWRWLDQRSPIASRLYEFSLLVFYTGTPLLRINYPTLAQYLPVSPQRYLSLAQRQLALPLKLTVAQDIFQTVAWQRARGGVFQLLFHRGPRVLASAEREPPFLPFMEEHFTADIRVRELRNLKPPEWAMVSDFYRLWAEDSNHRPTQRELEQARALIDRHGQTRAKALIPIVVKLMKTKWPDAKTFGAVQKYLGDAIATYDRGQRQKEQRRKAQARRKQEHEAARRRQQEEAQSRARWELRWQQLPESEKRAIQETVVKRNPFLARHMRAGLLHTCCLQELASRSSQRGRNPLTAPQL